MASATLKSAQETRINALKEKHMSLSNSVAQAQRSPSIPDEVIKLLKKQKLMVKEEIARIRA